MPSRMAEKKCGLAKFMINCDRDYARNRKAGSVRLEQG
jgi:hypothetical protein